jgi:hypothetical protein
MLRLFLKYSRKKNTMFLAYDDQEKHRYARSLPDNLLLFKNASEKFLTIKIDRPVFFKIRNDMIKIITA